MDSEIKQRLVWVQLYLETGGAGLTCRRCGISRPTLRKWVRRYEELVLDAAEHFAMPSSPAAMAPR